MTPMWTLDQALELVRGLGPKLNEAGFGIAIAGSVLLKGESKKDLDRSSFRRMPGTSTQTGPERFLQSKTGSAYSNVMR